MNKDIPIKKGRSDLRNYYVNKLPNDLKFLLISDPDADMSSASLSVNSGGLLDPPNYRGLAHFCEHMLFMGTEKYPSENEFEQYLNINAGYSNAYTSLDLTNYQFTVSNEGFLKGLDMFAQFFIKPLFMKSSVEREMQAVDSEHKKNIQSDYRRHYQLLRSEAIKESHFHCFTTGDINTLNKPEIREELLKYHSKYYSSNRKALVVLSNLSIEELKKAVVEMFSSIPKFEVTMPNFMEFEPYTKANLEYLYKITPVTQKDEIRFNWYLNKSNGQH